MDDFNTSSVSPDDNGGEKDGEEPSEAKAYVLITNDRCRRIFAKLVASDHVFIHRFESDIDASYSSRKYRSELGHSFGLQGHSHIVEETTFGHTHEVHLTVVEMTAVSNDPRVPYCWIEQEEALVCVDKLPIQHIRDFMRTLLLNKRVPSAVNQVCPWYAVGYYNIIIRWIEEALREKGLHVCGAPEQLRCTPDSVIYSILTQSGQVFFKACAIGSGEAVRSETIMSLFPQHTARLVSLNRELEAIITDDHGLPLSDVCFLSMQDDPTPGYEDRADIAGAVLTQWASIQMQSATLIEQLLEASSLPVLDETWIRKAFEDVASYIDENQGLFKEVSSQFLATRTFLELVLGMWEASGIPKTLLHGDLFSGNVSQPGGPGNPFIFFDWDCAAVGYPFMDLRDPDWFPIFKQKSK